MVLRAPSNLTLNVSKGGASTTSLGHPPHLWVFHIWLSHGIGNQKLVRVLLELDFRHCHLFADSSMPSLFISFALLDILINVSCPVNGHPGTFTWCTSISPEIGAEIPLYLSFPFPTENGCPTLTTPPSGLQQAGSLPALPLKSKGVWLLNSTESRISEEGVLRDVQAPLVELIRARRALAIWIQVVLESGFCSSCVKVTQNVLTLTVGLQKAHWPLTYFSPNYQRLGKNTAFNILFIPMKEKMFNEWLRAVMCQRAKREASQWNPYVLSGRACSFKKINCQQFYCAEPQMCNAIKTDNAPRPSSWSQAWWAQRPPRPGEPGDPRSLVSRPSNAGWPVAEVELLKIKVGNTVRAQL